MRRETASEPPAGDLRRFAVGDLVVDVGAAQVTRGGERLAVVGLSFDVLVALARAWPALVTTDDLLDRVWAGVVVNPETVNQRVKMLRDALGDDPRAPTYVASIRGRGYRLVPAVVPLHEPPAVPLHGPGVEPAPVHSRPDASPPETPADAVGRFGRPSQRVMFAVAGVVALVAVAVLAIRERTPVVPKTSPAPAPDARSVQVIGLQPRTVAVLPFSNLSGEPGNAYIGLGFAEMVLNRLATSDRLIVLARSSSFAFEGRRLDVREIGRQLGVRYLVLGSVQRVESRLRVSAQLVDAESGRALKALTFDRAIADVFAVQDEIATEIAAVLDTAVDAAAAGTSNVDAHLAYLRGLEAMGRWRVAEAEAAIRYFLESQHLDPRYAAAYVGEALARMQLQRLRDPTTEPPRAELRALAEKAIALDPRLGRGYAVRGQLIDDPAEAERELRRAVELAPNDAEAWAALGNLVRQDAARQAEAVELLDRAVLLDPLRPMYRFDRLRAAVAPDDPDARAKVQAGLLEILEIDPNFTPALARLSNFKVEEQSFADAIEFAERAYATDPRSFAMRSRLWESYAIVEDADAAADVTVDAPSVGPFAVGTLVLRGDLARAGELARTPIRTADGGTTYVSAPVSVVDVAIVAAVLDDALRTREYARGLHVLRAAHCPEWTGPDCAQHPAAALAIAHLMIASGDRERGEALIRGVLAKLDSNYEKNALFLASRAKGQVLLGRGDDAIRSLEEAYRTDGFLGWWIWMQHDRSFDPIREDPRFQSLLKEIRAQVARERASLEEMRRTGRVPRRPRESRATPASSAPAVSPRRPAASTGRSTRPTGS